ncbi:hypothetical protein [Saccharopolyspora spinosa]|uniref:hypothetical protein n=2 Tax=Saccharopolyspora spinosa TaxID=60894 RepID=UPI0011D20DB5|nr:hypothetical protein [Saccharopolyspora spinosa]
MYLVSVMAFAGIDNDFSSIPQADAIGGWFARLPIACCPLVYWFDEYRRCCSRPSGTPVVDRELSEIEDVLREYHRIDDALVLPGAEIEAHLVVTEPMQPADSVDLVNPTPRHVRRGGVWIRPMLRTRKDQLVLCDARTRSRRSAASPA